MPVNHVNHIGLRRQLVSLSVEADPPGQPAAGRAQLAELEPAVTPRVTGVLDSLRNLNDLDAHFSMPPIRRGRHSRCGCGPIRSSVLLAAR